MQKKFKFHYPARGRKPKENSKEFSIVVFKFHYPARGRKHEPSWLSGTYFIGSNSITPQGDGNRPSTTKGGFLGLGSNSITPQGDGNPLPNPSSGLTRVVQIPLPRKGTETIVSTRPSFNQRVQIPLPRKGTETDLQLLKVAF